MRIWSQLLSKQSPNNTPLFAFQPITTGDVHKIIKSLPSNIAPGCDKVNAKILKDSSPVIAPIITSLINNSFTLSTFPLPWKKQKSFQFLSPRTVKSLQTRGQYHYCLFYLKYAKERLSRSLPISSIQTMSYITCKVEIENFTQPSLHYFTSPMNCLITWIRRRYLLLFFWTCPKLLIAKFDFAKLVYLSLRVPGSKAIYRNVNKTLNFRILYLIPYPIRLGYRRDPSWARCCLHFYWLGTIPLWHEFNVRKGVLKASGTRFSGREAALLAIKSRWAFVPRTKS